MLPSSSWSRRAQNQTSHDRCANAHATHSKDLTQYSYELQQTLAQRLNVLDPKHVAFSLQQIESKNSYAHDEHRFTNVDDINDANDDSACCKHPLFENEPKLDVSKIHAKLETLWPYIHELNAQRRQLIANSRLSGRCIDSEWLCQRAQTTLSRSVQVAESTPHQSTNR